MYRVSFSCYVHSISYALHLYLQTELAVGSISIWVGYNGIEFTICAVFCFTRVEIIWRVSNTWWLFSTKVTAHQDLTGGWIIRFCLGCNAQRNEKSEISFEDRQQGPKCSNAQPNEKRHQFWRWATKHHQLSTLSILISHFSFSRYINFAIHL